MRQNPSTCSRNALWGFLQTSTVYLLFYQYGQSDTHYGSLKLLKLPDLACYFTCILGSKFSSDFICASFHEAEHRFCFWDRFTLHSSTNRVESSISTTFSNRPLESKSLASFTTKQLMTTKNENIIYICGFESNTQKSEVNWKNELW